MEYNSIKRGRSNNRRQADECDENTYILDIYTHTYTIESIIDRAFGLRVNIIRAAHLYQEEKVCGPKSQLVHR